MPFVGSTACQGLEIRTRFKKKLKRAEMKGFITILFSCK